MGRRRFVETLVGVGFSSGMANALSADDFEDADDDEVPIVYGFVRSDPDDPTSLDARTKTVSAGWYDEIKAAFSAHRRLELELDGTVVSSVVPGSFRSGGTNLLVEVSHEDLVDRVPEVVDQVPVVVDVIESLRDALGHNDADSASLAPGARPSEVGVDIVSGVACSNGNSNATLSAPLYDANDQTRYFVTSNHLYGGDGRDNRGEPCYVTPDDGDPIEIGTVEYGYEREDFVLIRPNDGYVPVAEIQGATPTTVTGGFTRWGLADLKARGSELEKIGATTGHTSGPIKMIDAATCAYGTVCQTGQLAWGSEDIFSDGDSGSVAYHPDPENPDDGVLIAGLNNARTWWPGANYVWGTAAHVIADRFEYFF